MTARWGLTIAVATLVWAGSAGGGDAARYDAARVIAQQRAGLARILAAMDANPGLIPKQKLEEPRMLRPDQRKAVLALWAEFGDRVITLEMLALAHAESDGLPRRERRARLALHRAAFYASYRHAMDWIERIERDPGLPRLLDEAHPDAGSVESSYSRLKYRYLHVGRASEFAALEALHRTWGKPGAEALRAGAKQDASQIWRRGAYSGPKLTATNAVDIVKGGAHSLWLPVQERFARWMGDMRVRRSGEALISKAQIAHMLERLEPGDILLQRREWYLTNAGIPGFWTHAALYVGTPADRARVFGDPSLEDALRAANPAAYANSLARAEHGAPRVLEAIAEGVRFTALEKSAFADSLAVLRPRLAPGARAAALRRAFGFAGRPYDYDFDFLTDSALVCSELIYKAYQPTREHPGLQLPVETVAGRLMMTPNQIAQLFQRERERAERRPQLDFVLMLDGDEGTRRAEPADAETFATSWRRPKWHIVTKRAGL